VAVVVVDRMVLDSMRMFVVGSCEMILNFEIIRKEVDLVVAVVVVVVDWRMLMDSLLDEIMVETLKDDHHDRLNHHERTFVDEEDESLHFDRITKNKTLKIFV
jgi:hypothetical protein